MPDETEIGCAASWRLATMEPPVGPDDALLHAHACGTGRRCFSPAAEPTADAGGSGREPR